MLCLQYQKSKEHIQGCRVNCIKFCVFEMTQIMKVLFDRFHEMILISNP